ncbi:MAG: hypothetical protein ACKVWV_15400 [Planctomycetota bacterium]
MHTFSLHPTWRARAVARWLSLCASVAATALLASRGHAQEPPAVPAAQAPPAPPVYEPVYHDRAEIGRLFAAWLQRGAERVAWNGAGTSTEGASEPPSALRFGAPGPIALSERPTIVLVGALDGASRSGTEAVLAVCDALLASRATLPDGLAFVAIPCAAPDALERTISGASSAGTSSRPMDDDGDRAVDEDVPDDVDGDGRILDLLIEDADGEWTRSSDERFLARARAGDAPRYRWVREGRDDDRDGLFNEDPVGGVIADANFPMHWDGAAKSSGDLPLDDAHARALAEFVTRTHVVAALVFQGNHGELAVPGGVSAPLWPEDADAALFERITALFAQSTGRAQPRAVRLHDAHGGARTGTFVDWAYAARGAIACEIAAWGPAVERSPDVQGVGLADANLATAGGRAPVRPLPPAVDRAWARWLDNTRGGIGFVDWHPVELGDGRAGLVGGWEAYARVHPPPQSLPHALAGLATFVEKLAANLPALDVELSLARRDGDVVTLTAHVTNRGALPTGSEIPELVARDPALAKPVELALVLPDGARLLAGERSVSFERIPGGGRSASCTWVVLAAPGSAFTLRARAPWTALVSREVKP